MIYFISDGEYTKIGFVEGNDVQRRLAELQVGNARELTVLATINGGREEERIIHAVLDKLRIRGEWFRLSIPDGDLTPKGTTLVRQAAEAVIRYEEEARQAHRAISGEMFDRRLLEEILAIKRTKATGVIKAGVEIGLFKPLGNDSYLAVQDYDECA